MAERIVVLGGGIVGASVGYHLAAEGASVTLVDRHDPGHATFAGAGILSPGTSQSDVAGFYRLAKPAVSYYETLVPQLAEIGAPDTSYSTCGKIFLAENDEEGYRLPEALELFRTRFAEGMPALGAPVLIDRQQVRELFPAVMDVPAAIYAPESARVNGDHMRDALLHGAVYHGMQVRRGDAHLIQESDRVVGVRIGDCVIGAESVVLATGAWSNALLEPLGVTIKLEPQKGQIFHMRMEGSDTSGWPTLGGFHDQYVLAFGPDRIVAGATRETGSGFDLRKTAGGVRHVMDHSLRVAPGLGNATLTETRVGLRPFASDRIPYIGAVPGYDNVVLCTGHGPSGLQLGPYSGKLAAQIALGQDPEFDIAPFRVDR